MKTTHSKYIIIGAGLSGLVTAYQLLKKGERDFQILEARDRVGGRILTKNGIDLGATWFQKDHQSLLELLEELQLARFPQYANGKGVLVYNATAKPHYFEQNPNEPMAKRIVGGTITLIDALAERMHSYIRLNIEVKGIEYHSTAKTGQLHIKSNNDSFSAAHVIVTVPPKLALQLKYVPELPEVLQQVMLQTHTWMSTAIKVGLAYKTPFWRHQGLSGTLMSQISPVTELYDHSNSQGTEFALMGFVNERMRHFSLDQRKSAMLNYLEEHLGTAVYDYLTYTEKDWGKDLFTSTDLSVRQEHPRYGHPLFGKGYFNNRLFFSGTETSPVYGGYLEGAIYSGLRASIQVLNAAL